jgi:helix-turn-helix protein
MFQTSKEGEMTMKGYIVFNKDVAAKLMLTGEELIATRKDKKEPNKNVYIFRSSKTIQKNIKNIITK